MSGSTSGTRRRACRRCAYLTEPQSLTFVPVSAGTGPVPRGTDAVRLLGWRSGRVMLVLDTDAAGHLTIAEVDLRDGTHRRLSRFGTGSTCEFGTQSCQVFDLQLATGLLPGVTVRHATSARRGPWPIWLTVTVAIPVLCAVLLAGWLVRRRS